MPTVPLTTLLSWAWVAHTIEVDNAVEAAGAGRLDRAFAISVAMWANGLRFLSPDGITARELRARAGCACNLGGLERWGWIAIGEASGARRPGYGTRRGLTDDVRIRATGPGSSANRLFAEAISLVEERWRQRFGGEPVERLRAALLALDGRMPWSPPEIHPSDGFFTHVVPRVTEEGERPLIALLGQALTALTLEREHGAALSLPLAANVVRVIGTETVSVRALPARSGVSREAIAMGTGYLQRLGLGAAGPGRTIRLTPKGIGSLAGYRERARPGDAALRGALQALLRDTAALSAGLRPPEAGWRNRRPYVAQTRRLVADPTGALPWHPMVLHRGGWPDGS